MEVRPVSAHRAQAAMIMQGSHDLICLLAEPGLRAKWYLDRTAAAWGLLPRSGFVQPVKHAAA